MKSLLLLLPLLTLSPEAGKQGVAIRLESKNSKWVGSKLQAILAGDRYGFVRLMMIGKIRKRPVGTGGSVLLPQPDGYSLPG